jgi:hypothetical protein
VNGVVVNETTTYTVAMTSAAGCTASANTLPVQVGVELVASISGGATDEFCFGGVMNRTASATGGGQPYVSYAWTYNGDPVGNGTATLTNFAPSVSGTLLVTITDNCGATDNASVAVTVNPLPIVAVAPTSNLNCGAASTELVANGASTYTWSPAAGLSATSGATVTATPTAPLQPNTTVYTVTGTDGNGCVNTATASVTVDALPPQPTAVTDYAICANVSMPLNQGLTTAQCATTGVASTSLPLSFPGAPLISEGTGFTTRSTLAVPALPAGAVVISATLTMPSITVNTNILGNAVGANLRIRLNGVSAGSVLAETAPLPGAAAGTFAAAPISISAAVIPTTGGNIVFQTRQTSNATFPNPDVSIASATLTITYEIRPTPNWYTTDQGGTAVATGTTYNPVQGGQVQNNVPGATTFYVGCKRNDCESIRLPATFTVNEIPVVTCGGPYDQQCTSNGLLTLVGSPAGGTWSGTGVSGSTFNPTTAGPGSFVLTYSFTNEFGCTVTCQTTIGVTQSTRWYADQDGDTFGDPNTFIDNCLDQNANAGYVLNSTDNCPTFFGLIGDVCDANVDPNTFVLGEVTPGCACEPVAASEALTMVLQTDANPAQTTWEITPDNNPNLVICSGTAPSPNSTVFSLCDLPTGCFKLRVFDSGGDGMVVGNQGGYVLKYQGAAQVIPARDALRIIDNTRNFNGVFDGNLSTMGSGPNVFCLPMGTQKPIYTSRDKLDWLTGQYFVAEEDAAVSAQWQQGDQTDDGYEFWIFDPNGSYSFRRFRNHATSDNFGNIGAARACHMKIDNWATASHVPQNRLMNIRIRPRVNGVNGPWGPAYRFKIDPTRAACALTNLNDLPGDQYESCNQNRQWGSGWIHARPVPGANKYQFRFRIVAEGFITVITSNTYFQQLNWPLPSPPLTAGKTYTVEVRASKTNGATWCTPWSEAGLICTLTIDPPTPMQGGGQELGEQITTIDGLSMWPNPNRGDQVWINVEGIASDVETVTVDFYDLTGKRIVGRVEPTQGDRLNMVMDLNGDLAPGMYLVNITAGQKTWTQRLVIAR